MLLLSNAHVVLGNLVRKVVMVVVGVVMRMHVGLLLLRLLWLLMLLLLLLHDHRLGAERRAHISPRGVR